MVFERAHHDKLLIGRLIVLHPPYIGSGPERAEPGFAICCRMNLICALRLLVSWPIIDPIFIVCAGQCMDAQKRAGSLIVATEGGFRYSKPEAMFVACMVYAHLAFQPSFQMPF